MSGGGSRRGLIAVSVALGVLWFAALLPPPPASFTNPDDWYHLGVSAAAAEGEAEGLRRMIRGAEIRSWRAVPGLVWLADWSLWGLAPRAYLVTNYLLGGLLVGLVAFLAGLLAGGPDGASTTGDRWPLLAAIVAGTLTGCAPDLQTGTGFLAGRDDYLAALFTCVAGALWTGREDWHRGLACAALMLAVFSKPTAAVAPALLVAVDAALGRLPRDPMGWLKRHGPPVFWVGVYVVVAWSTLADQASHTDGGPAASALALIGAVVGALASPFAGPGPDVGAMPEARWLLFGGAAGLALACGTARLRAALAGLGWLVVAAAPFVYALASRPETLRSEARYLLPAAIGLGVGVGALVGRRPARLPRLGAGFAALVGLAVAASWWGWVDRDAHRGPTSANVALIEALPEVGAAHPDAVGVIVALRHFDDGVLAALASPVLEAATGPIAREPWFFLEGSAWLFGPAGDGFDPARRYRKLGRLDLDQAVAAGRVLVADVGLAREPRYEALPPPPARRAPDRPLPSWPTLAGWTGGSTLRASGPANPRDLHVEPPRGDLGQGLRSPGVSLDPTTVCGMRVRYERPTWGPVEPSPFNRVVPQPVYVMLTWHDPDLRPWTRFVVAPLNPTATSVRFELGNSPTWRAAGRVHQVTLAAQTPGPLTVTAVELEACAD